jgi:CHAD domain-containing protein
MDSPAPENPPPPPRPVGFAHWMERVLEECRRASQDLAPDPVHDLRVALRRCRSMADGLMAMDPDPAWKAMKKAGKRLFSSLGELRDVQVMSEWVQKLGPAEDPETVALLSLLASREQEQKVRAAAAVDSFDTHQWRGWTRELPRRATRIRLGSVVFQHLALERWTEAYALHRKAWRNRSPVVLHQLRIGLKRFRYIVENFLPEQHQAWSSDLKEMQDLLGDVHDLDVLWATAIEVNAFANEESRQRWHEMVREAREKRVARYRERMAGPGSRWRVWRASLPKGEQVQMAAAARLELWASFLDPDFAHSERVAGLATQLFDGLSKLALGPSCPERDLRSILRAAALSQDVGRSRHDKGHHKSSYRLIRRLAPPLGWSQGDFQLAATVARFHRGALPQPRHKAIRSLGSEDKRVALYLAGILRLADALDRPRMTTTAQRLHVEKKKGALLVAATGYSPWTSAAENIAAARYLLEVVLRKPILIKSLKRAVRKKPAPPATPAALTGQHPETAEVLPTSGTLD